MPGLDGPDPAPHLTASFRAAFPTWRDLAAYLAAHATTPAFDTDRAARQLVMTDLLARFSKVSRRIGGTRGGAAPPQVTLMCCM